MESNVLRKIDLQVMISNEGSWRGMVRCGFEIIAKFKATRGTRFAWNLDGEGDFAAPSFCPPRFTMAGRQFEGPGLPSRSPRQSMRCSRNGPRKDQTVTSGDSRIVFSMETLFAGIATGISPDMAI